MKVRYAAVYKIHGVNKLPDGAENADLLALQNPEITALLTTEPEPHLVHIDESAAIGTQLLKGMFAPDNGGTL